MSQIVSWSVRQLDLSVFLLCYQWNTTTNLSYRFPILETSATASCGTTGFNARSLKRSILGLSKLTILRSELRPGALWHPFSGHLSDGSGALCLLQIAHSPRQRQTKAMSTPYSTMQHAYANSSCLDGACLPATNFKNQPGHMLAPTQSLRDGNQWGNELIHPNPDGFCLTLKLDVSHVFSRFTHSSHFGIWRFGSMDRRSFPPITFSEGKVGACSSMWRWLVYTWTLFWCGAGLVTQRHHTTPHWGFPPWVGLDWSEFRKPSSPGIRTLAHCYY